MCLRLVFNKSMGVEMLPYFAINKKGGYIGILWCRSNL
jgi:hypothetical protein